MRVSYMLTMEQLSVLAFFLGLETLPGLPDLPKVGLEKSDKLVDLMSNEGLLVKSGKICSVDLTLGFVLRQMASPDMLVKAPDGGFAACTKELGTVVTLDRRGGGKYKITPLPTPGDIADMLWEDIVEDTIKEEIQFSISKGSEEYIAMMSKTELEKLISDAYTEVTYE